MLNVMKCTNCNNDMVQSKAGWLCVECGHIEIMSEADKAKALAGGPKPPEILGHAAPEPEKAPEPVKPEEPQPEPDSKPEPKSEPEPAPEIEPEPKTEAEPTKPTEPEDVSPEKVLEQSIAEMEKHTKPSAEPETSSDTSAQPVAITVTPSDVSHDKVDPDAPLQEADLSAVEQAVAEIAKKTETTPSAATADDKPAAPADEAKAEPTEDDDHKVSIITHLAPAPKPESEPKSEPETDTEPETESEPKPEDKTPEDSEKNDPDPEPQSTPADPTPTEPALEPVAAVPPSTPPPTEPEPTPEPTPEPQPVPVTPAPTAPTAPATPSETPAPPPAAVAQPVPSIPSDAKPPLQPATHPRPMNSKMLMIIAAVVFGVAVIGGGIAYAAIAKPAWLVGAKPTPTPTATATATPTPTPQALGAEATPTPLPDTTQAEVRDTQRKADLAAYAAAYKAGATKGFYSVNPPAVPVKSTDPTTAQAYIVAKAMPAALGQIRYWPGGSCTSAGITPGATGTRYLALQIQLEGAAAPYCLDVK